MEDNLKHKPACVKLRLIYTIRLIDAHYAGAQHVVLVFSSTSVVLFVCSHFICHHELNGK